MYMQREQGDWEIVGRNGDWSYKGKRNEEI